MTKQNSRTASAERHSPHGARAANDAKRKARIVLGSLLALNLLAALLLLEVFGGSPEGLEAAQRRLESQLQRQRAHLEQTRKLTAKMQAGGAEAEQFILAHFLDQRRAAGDLLNALEEIESGAGIRGRGKNFTVDAIEGTEDYQLLTIDAGYDATFAQLVEFVNAVDRSKRLLILDSLQVTPDRDNTGLQAQAKMFAFIQKGSEARPEVTP